MYIDVKSLSDPRRKQGEVEEDGTVPLSGRKGAEPVDGREWREGLTHSDGEVATALTQLLLDVVSLAIT